LKKQQLIGVIIKGQNIYIINLLYSIVTRPITTRLLNLSIFDSPNLRNYTITQVVFKQEYESYYSVNLRRYIYT
jgi:hypothetical protein